MIVKTGSHPRFSLLTLAVLLGVSVAFAAPQSASAAERTFTFNGGGWGHGIGLSQYGARGYALAGKSYDWIIAHYYQGTRLETVTPVTVRVNLDKSASGRSRWRIQSGSSQALTIAQISNAAVHATIAATDTCWITVSGSNARVNRDVATRVKNADGTYTTTHAPGSVIATFTGGCSASAGGFVKMLSSSGPFDHSSVTWRGLIRFNPNSATTAKAVNHVSLEQYLYGVVPRESPSSWPAEALKSQAVAARSYVYQDAKLGRTVYCTTASQVYNGYSTPAKKHEAASANAAVDATKGEVVWYGSETQPVKTFFSSSTGGHTASIQDVWTESAPQPYYTGVDDADQASPAYRWVVGPLTASRIASLVRAQDAGSRLSPALDYSAPYPAVISTIVTERAASGYTHHVTLRWSNGASFRIRGDTLRNALDMKSTKFTVVTTGVGPASYEETDARLAWYGAWSTGSSNVLYGGGMRYSAMPNSQATVSFDGGGLTWIGNRGPAYGKAAVYLDGAYVSTLDLYAARPAYRQVLYKSPALTNKPHTFVVRVLRAKNTRSRGNNVSLDRVQVSAGVLTTATAPMSRYEQDSPLVVQFGAWTQAPAHGQPPYEPLSSGSHIYSRDASGSVVLSFYGSGVSWIGGRSASYGKAKVTLDDTSTVVTLTSATTLFQETLFSASKLDRARVHRLTIEPLGRASGGTNGWVSVDRFDVTGGWAVPTSLPLVTVENDARAVRYTGTWAKNLASTLSGGSQSASRVASTTATLTFEGTSVTWVATKGPAYGKAQVLVDGVPVATVDLYSATRSYQQPVFAKSGLLPRAHTLTVKVLGTKRAASTGTWIAVDAFRVRGRAN